MMYMIVPQGLDVVVTNINYWNVSRGIGLSYHGQRANAAVWGVSNCIIIARAMHSAQVEIGLSEFRRVSADVEASKAWNAIGSLLIEAGWLGNFDPIRSTLNHWIDTFVDPLKAFNDLELTPKYEAEWKMKERAELARGVPIGSPSAPTRNAITREVEAQWRQHVDAVEAAKGEFRARAAVANKTTAEAAEEFFNTQAGLGNLNGGGVISAAPDVQTSPGKPTANQAATGLSPSQSSAIDLGLPELVVILNDVLDIGRQSLLSLILSMGNPLTIAPESFSDSDGFINESGLIDGIRWNFDFSQTSDNVMDIYASVWQERHNQKTLLISREQVGQIHAIDLSDHRDKSRVQIASHYANKVVCNFLIGIAANILGRLYGWDSGRIELWQKETSARVFWGKAATEKPAGEQQTTRAIREGSHQHPQVVLINYPPALETENRPGRLILEVNLHGNATDCLIAIKQARERTDDRITRPPYVVMLEDARRQAIHFAELSGSEQGAPISCKYGSIEVVPNPNGARVSVYADSCFGEDKSDWMLHRWDAIRTELERQGWKFAQVNDALTEQPTATSATFPEQAAPGAPGRPSGWHGTGKPPETKAEKIAAVKAWEAIPKDERPKLESWLIGNFGTDSATGALLVPVSTFYGWRKLKKSE